MLHHLAAAERMNVEHPNTESCCLDGRICDRVRNVVKVQVQKDPMSRTGQFPDQARSCRSEQLRPDLESTHRIAQLCNDLAGLARRRDIEGDDDTIFCLCHWVFCGEGLRHSLIEV